MTRENLLEFGRLLTSTHEAAAEEAKKGLIGKARKATLWLSRPRPKLTEDDQLCLATINHILEERSVIPLELKERFASIYEDVRKNDVDGLYKLMERFFESNFLKIQILKTERATLIHDESYQSGLSVQLSRRGREITLKERLNWYDMYVKSSEDAIQAFKEQFKKETGLRHKSDT